MTIPEAVALVLQAGTIGVGGEIFVLDMGQPIRIADLAKQMIELAGFKPDVDIQIKYTGLRPGEKMFEEISHQKEQLVPTSHSKIFRFVSTSVDLFQLEIQFKDLSRVIESGDVDQIKKALQKVLPEYKPELTGRGY
jgi:FlaA1/EpsC-like NDP-sugar epimerase